MPALPTARRYTVEEVYAFPPDGNRYEVVHGELLVTPSPNVGHQVLVRRLVSRLTRYLEDVGMGEALLIGPADYFYQGEVYVQPDLLVAHEEELTRDWRTMRRLRLVVEVISPSSARGDRLVKRGAYQEAGVETYWVVDPDKAVVEVWHPGDTIPEIATRDLVWRVTPEEPEIRIALGEVFAPLPGEHRR